jgi:hypothetical protein
LIALNWIISILISIVPFFIHGAFVYENESRLCIPTPKNSHHRCMLWSLDLLFHLIFP